jgi:hypothetical protein
VKPENRYWQLDPAESPVVIELLGFSTAQPHQPEKDAPVGGGGRWRRRATAIGALLALSPLLAGLLSHGRTVSPLHSGSERAEARAEDHDDPERPRVGGYHPPNARASRSAGVKKAHGLERTGTAMTNSRATNTQTGPESLPATTPPRSPAVAAPVASPPVQSPPSTDAQPDAAERSSASDFAFGSATAK